MSKGRSAARRAREFGAGLIPDMTPWELGPHTGRLLRPSMATLGIEYIIHVASHFGCFLEGNIRSSPCDLRHDDPLLILPSPTLSAASAAYTSLYSSVVERQSCKLKVLGSIPSGGLFFICIRI